jgi:hypothetical protein
MDKANQVENPPENFESKQYMQTLSSYLAGVEQDGNRMMMPPNVISWGQLMLSAGILLGQLDQETSI